MTARPEATPLAAGAMPCQTVGRVRRGDVLGAGEERAALAQALIRAGAGDRAAFAEVYRRTSAKLFGICLRILPDRQAAEDVMQEVYAIIWRRAGGFDAGRASPITWLATIARNRAIDRLRASGRTGAARPIEDASAVADPRDDAFAQLAAREDAVRLAACLGELDERVDGVIRGAFWGGATYAELAEREDVPLGTMKSWVRRALLRLRECLER